MEEGEEHVNPESGSGYPLGLSAEGFDYGVIEEQSRDSESPIPSGTEHFVCCAVRSTVTKNFDTDAMNCSVCSEHSSASTSRSPDKVTLNQGTICQQMIFHTYE